LNCEAGDESAETHNKTKDSRQTKQKTHGKQNKRLTAKKQKDLFAANTITQLKNHPCYFTENLKTHHTFSTSASSEFVGMSCIWTFGLFGLIDQLICTS
jgi:hypothetical protein